MFYNITEHFLETKITSEMMKNPQVLAALQHQLDGIVGTPSGYIETYGC